MVLLRTEASKYSEPVCFGSDAYRGLQIGIRVSAADHSPGGHDAAVQLASRGDAGIFPHDALGE